MINFLYGYTEDNLRLQGTYFPSEEKEICILFVHGMCANAIENYFTTVWGKLFQKNGLGFLYGHTRGYSQVNDIVDKFGNCHTIGTANEIFEDCLFDIDLWIDKIYQLGYKKVFLLGHSLGCNKVLYYLYKTKRKVEGVIFASAPDMQGLTRQNETDYDRLLEEVKHNIDLGMENAFTSKLVEDYMYLSSKTFYNWYKENSNVDNFPILRNPKIFEQLASIDVPILTFSGSLEEELYLHLDLLKEKAIHCPSFTWKVIENTNHCYSNKEEETALLIIKWIKKLV